MISSFTFRFIFNRINLYFQLPVISIDGWITIAYAALPDSTPVGTVQALLAVGTSKQINNFKKSKSLSGCNSFLRYPLELYVPQVTEVTGNKTESSTQSITNGTSRDAAAEERHNNLKSMFSTFIDNLAAKLPERNLTSLNGTTTTTAAASAAAITTTTSDATTQTPQSNDPSRKPSTNTGSGKYMRPTSELLDDLQRALAIAPSANQKNGYGLTSMPKSDEISAPVEPARPAMPPPKMFNVHIEIENALHLPTFAIPPNKKGAKRHRNVINAAQNKSDGGGGASTTMEMEPNTYVTFEAAATNVPANSTTYTTNIIETSCSPRWNKQFEVYLSADYLQNVSAAIRFWAFQ